MTMPPWARAIAVAARAHGFGPPLMIPSDKVTPGTFVVLYAPGDEHDLNALWDTWQQAIAPDHLAITAVGRIAHHRRNPPLFPEDH